MRYKPRKLLRHMEDVATKLGVKVRWERGSFYGGSCSIKGAPVVILNKARPSESHLAILTEALRNLPLDSIYIRPAVREEITALIEQS